MAPKYAEITASLVVFLFLFFSIFLFTYRKGNKTSKNLLALFFLALGLAVADVFLLMNGTYKAFPQYAFLLNHSVFLYGPLLWLLTKSLTTIDFQIKRVELLHFLPFILSFLVSIFYYHVKSTDYKGTFLERANESNAAANILLSAFVLLSICIYLYFCFRQIQEYRTKIRESVSNVDRINLGWLMHTLLGFTGILIFSILLQGISIVFGDSQILYIFLVILLFGMLTFIMSAIVKGLKNDVLFSDEIKEDLNLPVKKLENVDKDQLEALISHMNKEKPFLDAKLSLKSLANQLDMNSRTLSTLINQGTSQSFFDFINAYRVKHLQSLIKNSNDEKLTILEVMYASGFNSKSSFNSAFKKHTSLTPTEWKRANL